MIYVIFRFSLYLGGQPLPTPAYCPSSQKLQEAPPSSGNITAASHSHPSSGSPPLVALTITKVPSSPHRQLRREVQTPLKVCSWQNKLDLGFSHAVFGERRVTLNQNSLVVKVCSYCLASLFLLYSIPGIGNDMKYAISQSHTYWTRL